jgi:undecaprenyl phosphate N,N'-diacetylbacillosamine 1-phosphate transferase
MYRYFIKPLLDRFVAGVALIIFSPVILVVAVLLYINNKGKIWYLQERPGRHGVSFRIVKFKTMTDARDRNGELLPDADRLTPIGRWVRKLSLDELPQLVNVLKGDMSIVGPRPLLIEYLPLYDAQQARRHDVKPGITGWAQINGRNAITWEQKFSLDVWYVDHYNFLVDIKVLFLTVLKVFRAEGISSGTSATMEKFRGNG